MERHMCKLCLKRFPNGRALGGHMRSHLLNHSVPRQIPLPAAEEDDQDHHHHHPHQPIHQLGSEDSSTESPSSSSSFPSSEEEAERGDGGGDEKGSLCYGLRENPKRSIRMVDPEFAFAVDAGSVILQDRESETESSKTNPTRRRSKRTRKLMLQQEQQRRQEQENKKLKFIKLSIKTESWVAEPEPVSSISDTTPEEDVAFCLMMLSRDSIWKRKEQPQQIQHQNNDDYDYDIDEDDADEEEAEAEEEEKAEKSVEETDESEEFKSSKSSNRTRGGKYKCGTCNKVFKSYQALGGHRASHKKHKALNITAATATATTTNEATGGSHDRRQEPNFKSENNNAGSVAASISVAEKKIHECPYCYRVFSSGQALGGHKRSHVTGVAAAAAAAAAVVPPSTSAQAASSTKRGAGEMDLNMIDLNLPAPMDEDDVSQIELSAVSDAEFVNRSKR